MANDKSQKPGSQKGRKTPDAPVANLASPACGGVTRERTADCGVPLDSWQNTTDEALKAEITIESAKIGCGSLQVTISGSQKPLLDFPLVSEPTGPHKVKVPKKSALILICMPKQEGKCTVKYTFRWQ
jgi:hypothetical protein